MRVGLCLVIWLALVGRAEANPVDDDLVKLSQQTWSHWLCSTYAFTGRVGTEARERHRAAALASGRQFLMLAEDAGLMHTGRGNIRGDERIPIQMREKMFGETHDFILGRIYDAAVSTAYVLISGTEKNWPDRARELYEESNCSLL